MDGSISGLIGRRDFLNWTAKGLGWGILGTSLPAFLAACAPQRPATAPQTLKERNKALQDEARAMIGDVLDFNLASDEWEGDFGFVKFRLHLGAFDGNDLYFIRTDSSDQDFATQEKLVFVPKLAPLAAEGLSGIVYLVTGGSSDQPAVFSSEPGRPEYTPAWRVHRASWTGAPRRLTSVTEITAAEGQGELSVERTNIILNAPMVKWSAGELAVDGELTSYLGQGQLVEAPDTTALTVTFKLHECFPSTRYIVTDHSISPAAEMTKTNFAPGLHQGPSKADTTGRTNVFMNGIEGPGPMGFQPSPFDLPVGDSAWSPYWDHYAYAWKPETTPRVLTSQTAVHQARDAGELDEFPGDPNTMGEVFTVNCPAPVFAPNAFTG